MLLVLLVVLSRAFGMSCELDLDWRVQNGSGLRVKFCVKGSKEWRLGERSRGSGCQVVDEFVCKLRAIEGRTITVLRSENCTYVSRR